MQRQATKLYQNRFTTCRDRLQNCIKIDLLHVEIGHKTVSKQIYYMQRQATKLYQNRLFYFIKPNPKYFRILNKLNPE